MKRRCLPALIACLPLVFTGMLFAVAGASGVARLERSALHGARRRPPPSTGLVDGHPRRPLGPFVHAGGAPS